MNKLSRESYVVMEDDFSKARPYTRIKHGKLEHVKGYAGKIGLGEAPKFEKTTKEERMELASWKNIKFQMVQDLLDVRTLKPDFKRIGQKELSTGVAKMISTNMKEELSTYTKYLTGECVDLLHKYISLSRQIMEDGVAEFRNVDAIVLNSMFVDSVRKLVYQEVESNRQQFTDHGIRHIVKNIETQNSILDVIEKQGVKISRKDRLLGNFIMINHDLGYSVPQIRAGGAEAVKFSREHTTYGRKIASEQKKLWNVDKVFTESEYDRILNTIATHDKSDLDMDDPLALATRISDNLSLFQKEKLPGMFEYVDGSKNLLLAMGLAAKRKNEESFEKYRNMLYRKIDKTGRFSETLKRDLKNGVREISYLTPKFTVGVLAGEISKVGSSDKSLIKIEIKHNKFDSFLQKLFDMGQRQVKKFLEDYGETDFSRKSYTLGKYGDKAILELEVK